jgi:hypothetical protein
MEFQCLDIAFELEILAISQVKAEKENKIYKQNVGVEKINFLYLVVMLFFKYSDLCFKLILLGFISDNKL